MTLVSLLFLAQLFPFPGPGNPPASGGTPPTFVSAANGSLNLSSNTYSVATFTTTAGNIVFLTFGSRATSNACNTITGITTTPAGDTYTAVPASNPSTGFECSVSWVAFNVQGSSTYHIVINGTGSSPAGGTYAWEQFTPGSLTAIDGTACSGTTASGTTMVCSTSMTSNSTPELVLAGGFVWDNNTMTAGSGYTIPTNGAGTPGSVGGIAVEYQIANPASGSYTPGFTNGSGGDGASMSGVLLK